ncbi:MAG: Malate dehydrogenase (Oxaloacetate-decarboxylating) [Candidatus Magasanikbacteria bacterium GW2011_GWD2_43_18]|uniref:Malate dehydrogenase (Oxaloacetate-decarboxylating) n=1 Tax=Candidatus Magasanikbacteria bacterium GW2011_GWE2_42_7 TaxID=1619052 RepID=A0A0G1EBD3_9BACT|nr:MAG: Malate dehydrogenase (Oxaloacetate-decarboxylating) [Candidatus Magasanikbacteria bacterium GW2011_GWE2_42_7]KKT05089.1 MAG: Malate dehydrogenase (Oxaloacetate-decarboxylating) [Candidatus Magasanikbacteria bacterium GW2011_GWD2_43_18]HBB38105.1 NAD-dependent malic enzyme [Candidatus Magasanikbacteria bacterium]HCC13140.1 NAD-dependent malic enzyme [Candidatus Magasanikbacteria bacterium]
MSEALNFHKKLKGKIEIISRVPITTREDLSLAYTPGVADACRAIVADPSQVYELTRKHNMVAVVTDGSAVLGLGNIGPAASLPVMEGKAILFKTFADVDAFPIALDTQDVEEIIETVIRIAPMFGGINLEDISAPRCFEIEERLQKALHIPVFHDDQHGTAIVVLAGLYNALTVVNKKIGDITVTMSGVGAAGVAITKLLLLAGVKDVFLVDSKGLVYEGREDLNDVKIALATQTNKEKRMGTLADALKGADVFVGVSKPNLVTADMVKSMAPDAIIFAMANPDPEILPHLAKEAGAAVVATGRSDFPNQINNVLAFPGVFRGLLDARIPNVTNEMKLAAARGLAEAVEDPTADNIIPSPFEKGISTLVAEAVKKAYTGNV